MFFSTLVIVVAFVHRLHRLLCRRYIHLFRSHLAQKSFRFALLFARRQNLTTTNFNWPILENSIRFDRLSFDWNWNRSDISIAKFSISFHFSRYRKKMNDNIRENQNRNMTRSEQTDERREKTQRSKSVFVCHICCVHACIGIDTVLDALCRICCRSCFSDILFLFVCFFLCYFSYLSSISEAINNENDSINFCVTKFQWPNQWITSRHGKNEFVNLFLVEYSGKKKSIAKL